MEKRGRRATEYVHAFTLGGSACVGVNHTKDTADASSCASTDVLVHGVVCSQQHLLRRLACRDADLIPNILHQLRPQQRKQGSESAEQLVKA